MVEQRTTTAPDDDPKHIRMFVDDVSGMALWPGKGFKVPGFDDGSLPMGEELRDRIQAWVAEYTESIGAEPPLTLEEMVDHDLRGHRLAIELQENLGRDYLVEYSFNTAAGSLAAGDATQ